MKITYTKTYDITYSIESFEGTEGGMDHEVFYRGIESIEVAIDKLKETERRYSGDVTITVQVEETISAGKAPK